MTNQHPITPPPELVRQWAKGCSPYDVPADHIATQAARWGADQELDACANWLADPCAANMTSLASDLLYSRRFKLPTLKEKALHILDTHGNLTRAEADIIRCALEQLDD